MPCSRCVEERKTPEKTEKLGCDFYKLENALTNKHYQVWSLERLYAIFFSLIIVDYHKKDSKYRIFFKIYNFILNFFQLMCNQDYTQFSIEDFLKLSIRIDKISQYM